MQKLLVCDGGQDMNYNTIKKNYERGLWSEAMVKMAVRKGIITKAQYGEITGQAYA